jgi:hypothetical protein
MMVTSGSAKGFDRIAGHEEIEGQKTTSAGRRQFDFVANEGAVQRIAKRLDQLALLQAGSVQAQITLSLCGKISSASIPIEG